MGKLAVIAFGRMAPVTIGHRRLAERVAAIAADRGGDPLLFLSKTYDGYRGRPRANRRPSYRTPKNPLRYEEKLRFVRDALGDLVTVAEGDYSDIFSVLRLLNSKGYDRVVIVGDGGFIARLFAAYNGVEYSYASIETELSGLRDGSSADPITSVSATQVREAVRRNDYSTFRRLVATRATTGELWATLREELEPEA